ncbi:MAG: (deoxy)nucleoside triphosphate pyrophosphohydrolase [Treponemataceae bacterium]|nr:(deoxy)nucleoside triphosphate pyrophosphohydrolase [Treponemataceae bacterium]
MKNIHVAAAVIVRADGNGGRRIFATQRGYGEFKGWWEFPGGKVEAGETAESAVVREVREELATEISVGERLPAVEYDYPDFHLTMDCFMCTVRSGSLELLEHEDSRWLSAGELDDVKWLPADRGIMALLREKIAPVPPESRQEEA